MSYFKYEPKEDDENIGNYINTTFLRCKSCVAAGCILKNMLYKCVETGFIGCHNDKCPCSYQQNGQEFDVFELDNKYLYIDNIHLKQSNISRNVKDVSHDDERKQVKTLKPNTNNTLNILSTMIKEYQQTDDELEQFIREIRVKNLAPYKVILLTTLGTFENCVKEPIMVEAIKYLSYDRQQFWINIIKQRTGTDMSIYVYPKIVN